jgi:hypothetical protein
MQSGIEKYFASLLHKIALKLRHRDRAVLFGAVLSFALFFPACFLGFLLSCVNYAMILKGATSRSELDLVRTSLLFSGILTCIWFLIFFVYAEYFGYIFYQVISIPLELINKLLNSFPQDEFLKV